MASNEIRHIVGQVADPISLIEGAHAWTINLAGERRVTIVRPDGIALEVWPAPPMRRLGESRDDYESRVDGPMVMLTCSLFGIVGAVMGFALGAWMF